jgi:RHS repeat-associated protein
VLGSSRFVLKNGNKDASNTVFSAVTYQPFGTAMTTSGSDSTTFAGEITDSPTGLVYLSARYYDPTIGRFCALDPELGHLSVPQTLNRWIEDKMARGYTIIDIGPNPNKIGYPVPTGEFYILELDSLNRAGYSKWIPLWRP